MCKNYFFILVIYMLIFSKSFSQTVPRLIVEKYQVPENWSSTVVNDSSYFPLFKQRTHSVWILKYLPDTSKKVTFYAFRALSWNPELTKKREKRYAQISSCISNGPKDFVSFAKSSHYFLLKRCPCSYKDKVCKELFDKLIAWVNFR